MSKSADLSVNARTCAEIHWPSWKPKDTATLLFVLRGEEILLIHKKRGLGKGKINGPGGRLEPGETAREAAIREVEEELLITPVDPQQRGRLRFQFIDGYSLDCHVFRAFKFTGTPAETEEARPAWFPVDALPFDRMWEDDQYWLGQMIEGQCFDGRFIFEDDRMLDMEIDFSG